MRILHYLALDTAAAVAAWSLLAGHLCGIPPEPSTLFWTCSGVWLVYVADRWLDSLPGSREPTPGLRHRFAGRHRGAMTAAWLVVFAIAAVSAIISLPGGDLLACGVLAALGTTYLLSVHLKHAEDKTTRSRLARSWPVAILVAGAACLFPLLRGSAPAGGKALVFTATACLFLPQTLATRHWEEGVPLPGFVTGAPALLGLVSIPIGLGIPFATAGLCLAAGIYALNRISLHDKVAGADWLLALAGTLGCLAALIAV